MFPKKININLMNKTERYTYLIVIVTLLLILLRSCTHLTDTINELTNIKEDHSKIVVQHLADSSVIYSMAQNEVFLKKELAHEQTKSMALMIMKMKSPKEIVEIKAKSNFKYKKKLDTPHKIDSSLYLKLPKPFSDSSKWFYLSGKIDTTGSLVIDSLTQSATFTYVVGDTIRSGIFNRLFRRKDTIVRLHIDNPNIVLQDFSNIYITKPKKWYQTAGFKVIAGAVIGGVIIGALK